MQGIFNMASDSGLFRTREQLERDGWALHGNVFVRGEERMLPLYEAKMFYLYDHRLGTYEGQTEAQANVGTLPRLSFEQQADPEFPILPQYWVSEAEVEKRLLGRWNIGWLLAYRAISRANNERTIIMTAIPRTAVGHSAFLMLTKLSAAKLALLWASMTSIPADFVARQKMSGSNLNFFLIKQFPALPPEMSDRDAPWEGSNSLAAWIRDRVLELTYSAWDMEPFARELGDQGAPFPWNEQRRFAIRAELDAAFFHLYGIDRDDVDYIMDTFPIVKDRDVQRYGTFRTKDLILEIYDAMAEGIRTGKPYQTILDPPPGKGPRHG